MRGQSHCAGRQQFAPKMPLTTHNLSIFLNTPLSIQTNTVPENVSFVRVYQLFIWLVDAPFIMFSHKLCVHSRYQWTYVNFEAVECRVVIDGYEALSCLLNTLRCFSTLNLHEDSNCTLRISVRHQRQSALNEELPSHPAGHCLVFRAVVCGRPSS